MNDNVRAIIAKNVKNLREKKGISQRVFSQLLGLHPSYISRLEFGKCNVPIDRLTSIANYFQVEVIELLK